MKLFNKPNWLKPEINETTYYIHLLILAAVALGLLQWWKGGEMFTVTNVLYSVPLLLAGDITAHTLLGLD